MSLYRMELDDEFGEPYYEEVTPAEFADIARREGWVRLDGIDLERVRRGAHLLYECIRPIGGPPRDLLNDTLDALDAALDALTPEEDT